MSVHGSSQKNVGGTILSEIFHYTETWTNVAGTNAAFSNAPKTIANEYR